jgi:hypothetical protein
MKTSATLDQIVSQITQFPLMPAGPHEGPPLPRVLNIRWPTTLPPTPWVKQEEKSKPPAITLIET